ncbi:hypothetical protein [Thermaerobacillus caldiproteolyticus]|uniref:hypothetical protein n=1 Tax=Thermaerobacillus caldiproteolyticus TaxID=247480 RepID=UPI0018F164B5|nr:hypothetical protein [Anoxybacillus caldiproteolyticus]
MSTIKREVGEQGKGFRLQRLRAIKLLLDKMKQSDNVAVYAGTEYIDDVYIKSIDRQQVQEIAEGDKDYHSKKSFSFMSEEVKNSLISFLDCWLQYKSDGLYFCFYTNVKVGKERNSEYLKGLGVTLPKSPIIELLMNKKYDESNLLPTVKKVLIDEYKKQYEDKENDGFLSIIEKMSDELWKEFLDRIDWKFEQEDDKQLEELLLEEIRNQPFYRVDIQGKESFILARLLDEFEKRQNVKDHLGRLISDAHVKTIFLEVAAYQYKQSDPVFELWEKLEPPSDKRNLAEKFISVSNTYNKRKLGTYARKIGAVKLELAKADYKDRAAYQYRIFEACEGKLFEILDSYDGKDVSPSVIDKWMEELFECAKIHLADKSQDYTYPFKNLDTLRNTILELFDSCFLSFDEMGDMNE